MLKEGDDHENVKLGEKFSRKLFTVVGSKNRTKK